MAASIRRFFVGQVWGGVPLLTQWSTSVQDGEVADQLLGSPRVTQADLKLLGGRAWLEIFSHPFFTNAGNLQTLGKKVLSL